MVQIYGPNAHLIGRTASELSSPFLMIAHADLEANIAAMAKHCARVGIALRPHVKTHKSPDIARLQLQAGACGLCVAKLGEAEAMADAGLGGLLITSPIIGAPMIARLMMLLARAPETIAVVDCLAAAQSLSGASSARGQVLNILIDVDIGMARTGVSPKGALELAQGVSRLPGLCLRGIQAYAGHLMHIKDPDDRRTQSAGALKGVISVREAFARCGLPADIISGGGTGTFDIDPELNVFTELQAGSYVFMDRQYLDVRLANARAWPFAPALFVMTRIISANHFTHATVDAGYKAFATDGGEPRIVDGAPAGAKYFFFGDEQGGISLAPAAGVPPLGGLVKCLTPHCDPTVNLHDVYHVFDGDRLGALWPITARGRVS